MIERQQTTWMSGVLTLVVLLAVLALVVLPVMLLFTHAMPESPAELEAMRARLMEPSLHDALLHSLGIALLAFGLAGALAIPVALVVVRALPTLRTPLSLLGLLPLAVPPFVGAALLEYLAALYNASASAALIGRLEVRGNSVALSAVYAVHYFPFLLFCLMAGLERVAPCLEESARNLGAGRLRVWGRIILPLAAPGLLMGGALTVLKVIEDVGAPLVLGVDALLAPQLLTRLGEAGLGDPELQVTALALFAAALVVSALSWSTLLPPAVDERHADRGRAAPRGALTRLLAAPPLLGLVLIALLPFVGLVLLALGAPWSAQAPLATAAPVASADLSTIAGGVAPTLLYVAGTALLVLLTALVAGAAGATRHPLTPLVRFAATLPFAVPSVVLALAYLYLGDRLGDLGYGAPALAYGALALVVAFKQLPLAQRILSGPMRRLHGGSLAAARGLGVAGPTRYLGIAVHALAGKMAALLLLGAAAAALELSAAMVLFEGPEAPYAMALFDLIRDGGSAALWATPATALVAAAALALAVAFLLLRRRSTRPHRPVGRRQPAREEK